MDIIKNPVVIGLFAGVLTYIYMSWGQEEITKKGKKIIKKNQVNLLIPLIVAVIFWFIAYAYFEYQPESVNMIPTQPSTNIIVDQHAGMPLPLPPTQNYRFAQDMATTSSDPHSFTLLTKGGISIPKTMPDVLIDMTP